MKYNNFVVLLFRVKLLLALAATAIGISAHDEISTTFECHDIDTDETDYDECHCHVPGEEPVKYSCEDDLLTMETLLALDKVDSDLYFGVRVEPEDTCTDYNISEYPYGPTLDVIKSQEMGGIYSAYENRCFDSYKEVDVEHLVARKEAHESGLCAADAQTKINFTNDLENIALASPSVNRSKGARDPADWLPKHNACWYVWQYLHVKRKYKLTIDESEQNAIDTVLHDCAIDELVLEVDESCVLPEDT